MVYILPEATLAAIRLWKWHHGTVFFITYAAMIFLEGCRKSFSDVKFIMALSLSPANESLYPYDTWKSENMFTDITKANMFFGELDLLCLLAFAIGLYTNGVIGDRVNLVYLLTTGSCLSAITLFLFGYLSVVMRIRHYLYFYLVYFFNGLFQSAGLPSSVAIMGNWFCKESGGIAFGIWSTHTNLGHILGSSVIALLLDYGYEYGMLLNSVLLFYGGVVVFLCLIPHPNLVQNRQDAVPNQNVSSDTGEEEGEKCNLLMASVDKTESTNIKADASNKQENDSSAKKEGISFIEALGVPCVPTYAVALFFTNMVSSGLLFWLPTYFSESVNLTDKESVWMSNMLDIGYILGSVTCGVASDIAGVRSPILFVMLSMSGGAVYLFNVIPATDLAATGVVMVLTGILVGGPTNIIHTSVCADLGKHPDVLASNKEATATITGIIAGTGTLGAAIGQFFIGVISEYGGWNWVFNFLLIMVGLSVLSLLPLVVCDVRTARGCNLECKVYDELPSTDNDETDDEGPVETLLGEHRSSLGKEPAS